MIDYSVFENQITAYMPSLFKTERDNDYITLSTPFEYPDGDTIDVFITKKGNNFILSDMGETIRHLSSYNIGIKNSAKRTSIIEDAIAGTGIVFFKGILSKEIKDVSTFTQDLLQLTQAIIRISDLVYTIKGRSFASFEEDVSDFLEINRFQYEKGYVVEGFSGRKYEIDFAVKVDQNVKLIKLVSPSSQSYVISNIEKIITTWFDISQKVENKRLRISLLDDTSFSFKAEHITLINAISVVCQWSNQDYLKKVLEEAA